MPANAAELKTSGAGGTNDDNAVKQETSGAGGDVAEEGISGEEDTAKLGTIKNSGQEWSR